ncbi:ABC transporter ATP-binding protein [Candidatus Magnetaquicoccus inordinatus]|uniref:ABC transporter ATP-binding protein n=1 Tax=Candidatus Magnetaquicoccus inordinatus TaxID=2496818 RepID=UPI00102BB35B|nr:nitrate ABC transporter ATP-binding protein [Candidatus Magnetaquicoccus inordinatus]
MALLQLQQVSKSYGEGAARTQVLNNINLTIAEGELVAIVGFSGAGKTTLVSLMAGLILPDQGTIRLRGQPLQGPGPDRGVVFQSYSLLPWMSVRENIALAVEAVHRQKSRSEQAAIVQHYMSMVSLAHAAERRPAELSGGMRQRVAVARALAMQPEILLLDEPLSALDALTRARLQDEIAAIHAQEGKTVLLITNDVDEALLLADRIIPLTPGPGATLGPEFVVTLSRPRDRHTIHHEEQFKTLRRDITNWMLEAGRALEKERNHALQLPALQPRMPGADRPPKAYRQAAVSSNETRYLEFSQVVKSFPTPKGELTVVDGFDMIVRKGEFISLIGHSGCGKSTVLAMAAGLQDVTLGGIVLDGREVYSAGPDRAVVFQSPSLFPWLTARQNVLLGVERVYPHATRAERRDVVEYYLSRVGLGDAMDKSAAELSNGMKQRVGIARAFALSPKLLLLDEPFGMLDSLTRWSLQEVLMEVWSRSQVTTLCVTHDVDEAILLADRVVMMSNGPHARIGRILEVDLPRPRSRAQLLTHPDYYHYREKLLSFLDEYEHGHKGKQEAA